MLIFAFVGYLLGRAIGYRIGTKGGRTLMERSGRLDAFRRKTIAKGDALFEKYPRAAPVAAPAPISGIHQVPVRSPSHRSSPPRSGPYALAWSPASSAGRSPTCCRPSV